MGKILRWILGISASGVLISAAIAMFAEPFWAAVYQRIGINSAEWVDPMSDFLLQTWVTIVAALFVGAAVGAWVHHLLPSSIRGSGKPAVQAEEAELPKVVFGNDWAVGIAIMSIQDVACAICGIEPDGYAYFPRARALAEELVGAVSAGWVCGQDAHLRSLGNIGNITLRIEGQPLFPATEKATVKTLIYTPSLRDDYLAKRPNLDQSWIPEAVEGNKMVATMKRL